VAQLLARRRVDEKGVVPPEKLGIQDELYKMFLSELENRNVRIKVETITD